MAPALTAFVTGTLAPLVFGLAAVVADPPPASPSVPTLPAAAAQTTPSSTPAPASPRQTTAARLAEAQRALDAARAAAGTPPEQVERLAHQVDLLGQLNAMAAEFESAEKNARELEGNQADIERQRAKLSPDGADAKPPYSFLLLDSLRDTLATQESRSGAIGAFVTAANEQLGQAIAANEAQQVKRRQAREAAEYAKGRGDTERAAAELQVAELAVEVGAQAVALRRVELDNARCAQQIHDDRAAMLRESIARISTDVQFSDADLQNQMARIEKDEADVARQLDAAQKALAAMDNQWTEACKRRDAAPQITPALAEEVQSAKLARDCQAREIAMLQKRVELLGTVSTAWRRRFAIATGRFEMADLLSWKTESAQALDQLNGERRISQLVVEQARKESADQNGRLSEAVDRDPELTGWIHQEQATLGRLIEAVELHLVKLDVQSRLQQKLSNEIADKVEHRWLARWMATVRDTFLAVANTEVARSGDLSVTIGKITRAVLLLVLGIVAARWLTRLIARRLLVRFGIQPGAALALQSLAFYALVVTSALFALRMVHVPLTAFAFMGGALAIGVGFGSQKVLNNFVSGLILLVEQPIRVGDWIEISGLQGEVARIGTRSTRIRTASNFEIIMPNSSLLENNVVNWTLSDSTIRSSIRVGLAYGSPLAEASGLLKQAADAHPQILRAPEPFVLFIDFADNALNFELFFWIDLHLRSDRRRIESDLRFTIDRLLRNAGIVIAFPQRDIHLDTARPIEVAIVPAAPAATSAGADSSSGNLRAA